MNITIATYNIKFHRAYAELPQLVKQHGVDILCLQECDIRVIEDRVGALSLATTARVGTMGLAIYCNLRKYKILSSEQVPLPSVWYEHVNVQPRFRLQTVRLKDKKTRTEFILANLHLANLLASNHGRRQQAKKVFEYVHQNQGRKSAIVVGDFNYPVFARLLISIARKSGFKQLGVQDTTHTHNNPFIRGKFDRIFVSKEISEKSFTVLPFGTSDHTPVVTVLDLPA